MCGIGGIIENLERSKESLNATVLEMVAPLSSRGPDSEGTWVDANAGIAFGHKRLSIIDLSPTGEQPMVSASGRFVITYNGELYNTHEIRAELLERGIQFQGRSDTEVLLEACAAFGIEQAVRRIRGMFAFAIWDRSDRVLYLVRDRIGIKPLYYWATKHRFLFASELKGLRAHPNFNSMLDERAVQAFLMLDYVPTPLSIFKNVRKLEPGAILRVSTDAFEEFHIKKYWTLTEVAQAGNQDRYDGTMEEATDDLEMLLTDSINRHLVSDVPVGMFLSGGIDSSTVVALAQQNSTRPIKTFSIGFSEQQHDEAPYARNIARHLSTDHCEHYVCQSEVRNYGPSILANHDEPFADTSMIPTWFLARLARNEVTVALSGDGGDEVFGGYERHISAERLSDHPVYSFSPYAKSIFRRIIPVFPRSLRMNVQRLLQLSTDSWVAVSAREMKQLAQTIPDPEHLHYLLMHGNIRTTGQGINGPDPIVGQMKEWLHQSDGLSPSERQQFLDFAGYLPDDILTKVDRASMAVSLEVRVPILDHLVVEFAFRLPPEQKTSREKTKRILRKILGRHVPEPLFERPKKGFAAPMKSWLKGPLREWAEDLMSKETINRHAILDPNAAAWTARRIRTGVFRMSDFRRVALMAWCEGSK